jgi:membrane associated rhomboid family serine protease
MITLIIIAITVLFSIAAFNRPELFYKYNFNPYQTVRRKQWYRLFSHALLHANWEHLFVNMFVLYSFGNAMEKYFAYYFGHNVLLLYLGLYLGGIVASSIKTLVKQKDNYNYNAVGASGAVSAVVFASIFFDPLNMIYFFAIIPIPGILFGILYLWYSSYMSKRNIDNVGHEAHFWGAVFGFVYPLLLKPSLIYNFIDRLF